MSAERWYHGGFPGLKRGQKILPPSVTGGHSCADISDQGDGLNQQLDRVYRRDRVYLAADPLAARLWASLAPAYGGRTRGGDLYEVVPDTPVEPDPDYLADDGGSVICESATIIRILERRVPRPPAELIARLSAGER